MQSVSRSCQSLRVCGGDANVFSPRQVRTRCEARRPISDSKSPIYAAQIAGEGPAPLHSKDSSKMLQQKEQQKSCRASTPRASPVAEAAPIQEARSPSASQSKKNGVAARPDSEGPKVSKAGTILDPCYNVNQSTNIMWHETMTSRPQREDLLGQKGCVLWMTGLSGSGKSTLAYTLDHALNKMGRLSYVLDGDNIRHGLCNNLSFCPEDRAENNRRVAEVAKLFADCGIITIVSFISPYIKDRENCRKLLGQGEFIEVYLKTSIEVCEGRDPKGLYKKARAGEIKGFTGIDDPYEEPPNPEVLLNANSMTPEEMASHLLQYLENHGMLQPYCQGA